MTTRPRRGKKAPASTSTAASSTAARNATKSVSTASASASAAPLPLRHQSHRPIAVPLSLPDESKWLSEPLCLIRKQIEVFAATPQVIAERRTGPKPPVGTAGIRCRHCADLPVPSQARGAMAFPKSISLIHQAVRNFHRYHIFTCGEIPEDIKKELREFKPKGNQSIKGAAAYWVQSCQEQLGLIDVEEEEDQPRHIRFRDEWSPEASATGGPAAEHELPESPVRGVKRRRSQSADEHDVLSPTRAAAFDDIDIDSYVHEAHPGVSIIAPGPTTCNDCMYGVPKTRLVILGIILFVCPA